jgi:hypothetical protein
VSFDILSFTLNVTFFPSTVYLLETISPFLSNTKSAKFSKSAVDTCFNVILWNTTSLEGAIPFNVNSHNSIPLSVDNAAHPAPPAVNVTAETV